jgi:putative intracellular protease/amidase
LKHSKRSRIRLARVSHTSLPKNNSNMANEASITLAVLLFPGFEPLDAAGPLELFGLLPQVKRVLYVAERAGPVTTETARMTWLADTSFADLDPSTSSSSNSSQRIDWLLVPGGIGARAEVNNAATIAFLRAWAPRVQVLMSVCTGAAALAVAGALDGRRATTNKSVFKWVASLGARTEWVRGARWVVDDGGAGVGAAAAAPLVVTSAGVSAGMDMAMAVIRRLYGAEAAQRVADYAEYTAAPDGESDPFERLIDAKEEEGQKGGDAAA